jgi:hypothetical protein
MDKGTFEALGIVTMKRAWHVTEKMKESYAYSIGFCQGQVSGQAQPWVARCDYFP